MRCASFANAAGFSRSAKIEEFQEGGEEEGEGEEERGDKITPSVVGATVRVIGVII